MRVYLNKTVFEAARERLDYVFAKYDEIVLSVSGGKDSTAMFHLAHEKAVACGRRIHCFFLDQEAEYQSTIEVVEDIMAHSHVVPHWYQVPLQMTSVAGYDQEFFYAWEPGGKWMREKSPLAVQSLDVDYPARFYPFIKWFESRWKGRNACHLVGLRAEESLNRYRAMIKNPAVDGKFWSSRAGRDEVLFYPIYDWTFEDVFYYFASNNIKYNRIYDFMHSKDSGKNIAEMRVSFLLHEKSYKSMIDLQEFEPETYEKLIARLKGARTLARYAEETTIYNTRELPAKFDSWLGYRDYLLETAPVGRKDKFLARFAKQQTDERVHRQQCRQLLINDWENNVPIVKPPSKEDWRRKWMEIL